MNFNKIIPKNVDPKLTLNNIKNIFSNFQIDL